jgi:hypothetical protein
MRSGGPFVVSLRRMPLVDMVSRRAAARVVGGGVTTTGVLGASQADRGGRARSGGEEGAGAGRASSRRGFSCARAWGQLAVEAAVP